MQISVIEFARNVLGLKNANSTEFDINTPHPVISLVTEWEDYKKVKLKGDINTNGWNNAIGCTKM